MHYLMQNAQYAKQSMEYMRLKYLRFLLQTLSNVIFFSTRKFTICI